MTLKIKSGSFALVAIFTFFLKTKPCIAECNLHKIFRTPRDFDHLEIVERAGFDRSEPTTAAPFIDGPPSKSTEKNGNNYANAQVSVRFGSDYGSSHIMKIPPQCRNLIGTNLNHPFDPISNPNFFYPPPSHIIPPPCPSHQYYHPYPPPVPYVFPNYYFWSPRADDALLPPQLNEYFRRHPDFVVGRYPHHEEVFVGGRPMRRGEVGKIVIPANFVDAKIIPVKDIEDLQALPKNLQIGLNPVQVVHSRILAPPDPTNETKDPENTEIKRDLAKVQKENEDEVGNNISMEFPDDSFEETYQRYVESQLKDKSDEKIPETNTKEFGTDLEKLLIQSLVAYKDENSKGPPKMLVSYPVINRDEQLTQNVTSDPNNALLKQRKFANDIDSLGLLKTEDIVDKSNCDKCLCSNITTNMPTGKSFIKDIDDLVSILIEIIDTDGKSSPSMPQPNLPDASSLFPDVIPPRALKPYNLDDSILFPEVISPFSLFPKLPKFDIDLPDVSSLKTGPPPLSTIFNLMLDNYGLSNAYKSLPESSLSHQCNTPKITQPECSSSSGVGYRTDPERVVVYQGSIGINLADRVPKRKATEYRSYELPETTMPAKTVYIPQQLAVPNHLKVISVGRVVNPTHVATVPKLEGRHNVECLEQENSSPICLQLAPRANFEVVPQKKDVVVPVLSYSNIPADDLPPPSEPESMYCKKCGHKHSGGMYCDNCGYPLIFESRSQDFCPSCPKETRQLNDW